MELEITEGISLTNKSPDSLVIFTWVHSNRGVDGRLRSVRNDPEEPFKFIRSSNSRGDIVGQNTFSRIRTNVPFKCGHYKFTTLSDYHESELYENWDCQVVTTNRVLTKGVVVQFRRDRTERIWLAVEINVSKADLKSKPGSRRSPTSWSHILDPLV